MNTVPFLGATVNSEAKNMASVTFFKITWQVKAGHLDNFGGSVGN